MTTLRQWFRAPRRTAHYKPTNPPVRIKAQNAKPINTDC